MTEPTKFEQARFDGFPSAEGPAPYGVPSPRYGIPAHSPSPYGTPPHGMPAQTPPPRTAGRRGVVVLSSVAAVLLVATGVLAFLYISATGDRETAGQRLTDATTELRDVRGQVDVAADERAQAEQATESLETENTDLQACVDAVQRYLWDGLEGVARSDAFTTMYTRCR